MARQTGAMMSIILLHSTKSQLERQDIKVAVHHGGILKAKLPHNRDSSALRHMSHECLHAALFMSVPVVTSEQGGCPNLRGTSIITLTGINAAKSPVSRPIHPLVRQGN